jgi:hypothetical protein
MGNKIDIHELKYKVIPKNIIKSKNGIKLGIYKGKYVLILDNKEIFIITQLFYVKDKKLYIESYKAKYNKSKIDKEYINYRCHDYYEFYLEIKENNYLAKLTKHEIRYLGKDDISKIIEKQFQGDLNEINLEILNNPDVMLYNN